MFAEICQNFGPAFSSHIFSLEIQISDSQVPWETASLEEQMKLNA